MTTRAHVPYDALLAGSALLVLAAAAAADPPEPRITRLGIEAVVPFPGHDTSVVLAPEHAASEVALLEIEVAPGTVGAPPHVHGDEDEIFIVLDGELTFLERERVVRAPAGTVAALTRGHLHAFWNSGDEPVKALLLLAPGRFASFFDEVVMELRREGATDPEAVGATIARIAKTRNVDVFPDRFPAEARALLHQ